MFVCLAAGKGTRMRPLTKYLHKAMIPFDGIPFLAYSMLALPIDAEVTIIVHHFADQIIGYFGESYEGRKIKYLLQADTKGTGDALYQFWKALDPKHAVIVWQADQMVFSEEVQILLRSEPDAALCSDTAGSSCDVGVWKLKPSTLPTLRSHLMDGEYKALPILLTGEIKWVKTAREKLEITFENWDNINVKCAQLKRKLPIGFR
jgi:hypothetical protein